MVAVAPKVDIVNSAERLLRPVLLALALGAVVVDIVNSAERLLRLANQLMVLTGLAGLARRYRHFSRKAFETALDMLRRTR